eukprot:CAMPEP_0174833924 /NCGR_PEP_ID=MMETSP1114-20130205/4528_1 /TAXON_ID=312471 /ORGANISM="Neobodo designis, Strain CCAP 1951/1" /LENGTH=460 /DNA_ID=CAMNT_0016067827 /DNA_START=29 /DNA_END=1406 /DNA_ORIENTATION=+
MPKSKKPQHQQPQTSGNKAPQAQEQQQKKKAHRAEGGVSAAATAASASPAAAESVAPRPVLNAILYLGTYHNVAAAYQLRKYALAPRFTSRSHVGSIVSVAACSRFLVASGSDESITIQAVKNGGATFIDLGKVTPPAQANSIAFPDPRFLVCAMEDGSVIIYKTREWTCAAVIAAHDRAATSVACHPKGTIAVTVGNDYLICVIDLTRAAVVTRRKLDKSLGTPVSVTFTPDGECFLVQTRYHVAVYDIHTAQEVARAGFERDPPNEIQTVAVAGAAGLVRMSAQPSASAFTAIVGIEAGSLHCFTFDPVAASAASAAAGDDATSPAKLVRPQFTPVATLVRDDVPALPVAATMESETGEAVQLRPRIRAAKVRDGTLFTANSAGVVQVFDLTKGDMPLSLCAKERARVSTGGRVTALDVLDRTAVPQAVISAIGAPRRQRQQQSHSVKKRHWRGDECA